MASVSKPSWGSTVATPPSVPTSEPHPPKSSRLPTAAEEKEMLRRYHDATRAVQRHHKVNFSPSDGIMPSASSTHGATAGPDSGLENNSSPAPDDLPPPWVPSPEFSQTDSMSEKERYRIAFQARERAVAAAEQQLASPPPPASPTTSPPADYYTATGTPHPGINGSDPRAAADSGLPPPWHPTPPSAHSGLPPHLRARSPPVPPSNPAQPGQLRILSAAEEKALLKARYEAEDHSMSSPGIPQRQQEYQTSPRTPPSSGMHSPIWSELPVSRDQTQAAISMSTPPRTPPPLMPRPPASYIQETAEEDARLQDELANGKLSATVDRTRSARVSVPSSVVTPGVVATGLVDDDTFGLLRPTSPFSVGWESISARTAGADANDGLGSSLSSPPPLPPKVPLEH